MSETIKDILEGLYARAEHSEGFAPSDATGDPIRRSAALDRCAAAEIERLVAALQVPKVWTAEEQAALAMAFARGETKHGHFEALFAVAAESLRLAQKRALLSPEAK